jgi:hypothetical protein
LPRLSAYRSTASWSTFSAPRRSAIRETVEKKPSNPKSSDNSGPATDNTAGDTPDTDNNAADTDNNAADTIIEWVTPGSKHFVCYGSFTEDKNLGYSISEVHFCLARLFAGLMTVLLGLYCVYLPFVTALVAFASLIAISTTCRPNEKSLSSSYALPDRVLTICLVSSVLFCSTCIVCPVCSTVTMFTDGTVSPSVTGWHHIGLCILMFFCGIASVLYRAHANQILSAIRYEENRQKTMHLPLGFAK